MPKQEKPGRYLIVSPDDVETLETIIPLEQPPTPEPPSPREKSPELTATWQNPETMEKKEIKLNIEQSLRDFQQFYQSLSLEAKLNGQEVRNIWQRNYQEIKKEIETYGYDTLLIIPGSLPSPGELNQKTIETMDEPGQGKVKATYQSSNFKDGGSFAGVKNTETPKLKIILTHSDQNILEAQNPYLKATLKKDIMQLTGMAPEEVNRRIQNQLPLPINFEEQTGSKAMMVQAEGLSLTEYEIFQRYYFEKNQGHHLDEKGWTWLLKSLSGSRVVDALWDPARRRFFVGVGVPGDSSGLLGARLSRSFS